MPSDMDIMLERIQSGKAMQSRVPVGWSLLPWSRSTWY